MGQGSNFSATIYDQRRFSLPLSDSWWFMAKNKLQFSPIQKPLSGAPPPLNNFWRFYLHKSHLHISISSRYLLKIIKKSRCPPWHVARLQENNAAVSRFCLCGECRRVQPAEHVFGAHLFLEAKADQSTFEGLSPPFQLACPRVDCVLVSRWDLCNLFAPSRRPRLCNLISALKHIIRFIH